MKFDYDCIVVGSGFGGSVMSLRLVEKGYHTLLLERGQRWPMMSFPRTPTEIQKKLLWDPEDQKFGLIEVRNNPDSDLMTVAASGLGGGSLIYANTLLRMPAENFQSWPGGITRQKLDPYYEQVEQMLEAKVFPIQDASYANVVKYQRFEKIKKTLRDKNFSGFQEMAPPLLAIRFEGQFLGEQGLNKQGAVQSKCHSCGQCDIGCNIHAKNTLDLNYLFRAQDAKLFQRPLRVETGRSVSLIEKIDGGYRVSDEKKTFSYTCKKLFVSAGSVGSTELLLRSQKRGMLPDLNRWLGKKVCGNGDFIGVALDCQETIEPTKGPVITNALRIQPPPDQDGMVRDLYLEDGGYPTGWAWYLSGKVPQLKTWKNQFKLLLKFAISTLRRLVGLKDCHREINIGDDLAAALDPALFIERSMMFLGMGRDRSDGFYFLDSKEKAILKWDETKSRPHFDLIEEVMSEASEALGGKFQKNPLDYLDKIISVHPIGGCPMADSPEKGFVNPQGEVFGYPGLYVVDASIIPTSLGPNPSLTIAALAEYIADQIPFKA